MPPILAATIALIRPKDWAKNLFIFIPAFFAGRVHLLWESPRLILAFMAFSLTASAIYILNDLADIENDRRHPVKKNRPLAAGYISKLAASLLGLALLGVGMAMGFYLSIHWFLLFYVGLNIAYSFFLKNIPIIDVTIISIGFILRIVTGGEVEHIFISKWLILMTFLLSMCLALGKRRDEFSLYEGGNTHTRPSLLGYNGEFLNMALVFMAVTTAICYIMYSVSEEVVSRLHTDKIYYTTVFVIIGLLRFLQIVVVEKNSSSPTQILLKDRFMQLTLIGWAITFGILIYL